MTTSFLSNTNLQLIWELLVEEAFIKDKSTDMQNNIFSIFKSNLDSFYNTEKNQTDSLMTMNKKYIVYMLNCINTLEYDKKVQQNTIINSISITKSDVNNKDTNDLITIEEIHNDRKVQFENELSRHQQDFANAISQAVPNVPDFKIKLQEEPIKEMEKMIKEMTAKRNYDIEQINKMHYTNTNNNTTTSSNNTNNANNTNTNTNNTNTNNTNTNNIKTNWLESIETSIQKDKLTEKQITSASDQYKRHIKIHNKDINNATLNIINLDKRISFEESNNNIFNKLKKTNEQNNETINSHCVNNLETKVNALSEDIKYIHKKIDDINNLLITLTQK